MSHLLSRKFCNPAVGQKLKVEGVDYALAGKLGDGAAGLVRRAFRLEDKDEFAIKFLAPDPKYIDEAVFNDVAMRFRREGQRSPQLSHANLVRIHAYADNEKGCAFSSGHPKNPFILMEIVKGMTLESYIKRDERRRIEKNQPKAFMLTPERLSIAAHVAEATTVSSPKEACPPRCKTREHLSSHNHSSRASTPGEAWRFRNHEMG
jgi:serine/threonine protein kinase